MLRTWLLLSLTVLVACGPKDGFRGLEYKGKPPRIGLAPTVLLQDVPGSYETDGFLEGVYIGNILFSGGFEVIEADGGMQNRSVGIRLEMQDIYRRQVGKLVDGWFGAALTANKVEWQPIALPADTLVAPERTPFRGTYDALGKDNQNLPLFELLPRPLASVPAIPEGVGAILVPYLVHYYSHNGGWFQGQTYGTDAGARGRVLWSLHDAGSGEVVAWGDHEATASIHGLNSPNSSQIQDLLIAVEAQLAKSIAKHAP